MTSDEQGNVLRIHFGPELNGMVCDEIEEELATQISAAGKKHSDLVVEFDLSKTRYITSAFLRLCIFYAKTVGRKNFRLLNLNDNVKHVFAVCSKLST